MTIKKKLAKHVNKWIELANKQHEVVKYLFNHTELFEQPYIYDYKDDLFRFFAGKITRNANDINKLMNTLTQEDKEVLQEVKIGEL